VRWSTAESGPSFLVQPSHGACRLHALETQWAVQRKRLLTCGAGKVARGAQPTRPDGVNDGCFHQVELLTGVGQQEWCLHISVTVVTTEIEIAQFCGAWHMRHEEPAGVLVMHCAAVEGGCTCCPTKLHSHPAAMLVGSAQAGQLVKPCHVSLIN
jgi:hypothetical protein